MQRIRQSPSRKQDPPEASLAGALAEALRQLGELRFDPNTEAALIAAQLRLILTRIQRGIPPGHESLANLIAVAAGLRTEVTEVGA